MSLDADLATLRGVLSDWTRDTREWKIAPRDAETALARVEAEVARLQRDWDQALADFAEANLRAEATERELARLREGLRDIAASDATSPESLRSYARALLADSNGGEP